MVAPTLLKVFIRFWLDRSGSSLYRTAQSYVFLKGNLS